MTRVMNGDDDDDDGGDEDSDGTGERCWRWGRDDHDE